MNKRDKQKEETYAEILRVGKELFIAKGYEHTSIQQIAKTCGMTKGALYHHFDSKEALLEQICQDHYQYLLEAARPFIAQKEVHWFKRLGLILGAIKEANEGQKEFAGEYLKVRKEAGGGISGQRLAHYDKQFYITVIAPILSEARDTGEVSFSGSAETLSVFIYYLDKAMTDEISNLLSNSRPEELEAALTDILETFVHSLSALLGIAGTMVRELIDIPRTIEHLTGLLSERNADP